MGLRLGKERSPRSHSDTRDSQRGRSRKAARDQQHQDVVDVAQAEVRDDGSTPASHLSGKSDMTVLGDVAMQKKITDDYVLHKKLGQGSYGKVRLATNKASGEKVAVKSVLKKNLRRLTTLRREISIMKKVRHPNIIALRDVFEDEAFLHIVMELCTGGELFDQIVDAGHLTENAARLLVYQMLDAVKYLHTLHIAHRDLKPENFLFGSKDDNASLKLIDFGLSRFYQDNVAMKTRAGTPYYLAPEVLEKQYDEKW